MNYDNDLYSIQQVRNALAQAAEAQRQLADMSQEQINRIVEALHETALAEAEALAVLAVKETGFGNSEDKTAKNRFAARDVYAAMKDMKTVGIIRKDEQNGVWEIAQPFGVIAGIVPSTNPTSTVIFKSLIAVKARNAIVFSPHPAAANCSLEAAKRLQRAAEQAGAPPSVIQCIDAPTLPATRELMTHPLTNLILATGGKDLVKAAYSSGKPAYGVGPGNVPVYVHKSASLEQAARRIVESKTFDYGTICASEQAVIADQSIRQQLLQQLVSQGAYVLNEREKAKLAPLILNGKQLNPKLVGRSPQRIAELAGLTIPPDTTVLVAEEEGVGPDYPFSVEKLCPILAFYSVSDWKEAEKLSIRLLQCGGLGHTFGIHCEDEEIIAAFGASQPASRIVVNSGTTFGGIGGTTGLQPSLTLGCGSYGGNITSDNIGPQHLLNVRRVAFGRREMAREVRAGTSKPSTASNEVPVTKEMVIEIIKKVLQETH